MKAVAYKVKAFVFGIVKPTLWVQNNTYSPAVDDFVRDIIDNNTSFDDYSEHTVTFGGITIWVSNYPYSYGTVHNIKGSRSLPKGRPSRLTIWQLKRYIDRCREAHARELLSIENVFLSKLSK